MQNWQRFWDGKLLCELPEIRPVTDSEYQENDVDPVNQVKDVTEVVQSPELQAELYKFAKLWENVDQY
jgi:hypothetical protein